MLLPTCFECVLGYQHRVQNTPSVERQPSDHRGRTGSDGQCLNISPASLGTTTSPITLCMHRGPPPSVISVHHQHFATRASSKWFNLCPNINLDCVSMLRWGVKILLISSVTITLSLVKRLVCVCHKGRNKYITFFSG